MVQKPGYEKKSKKLCTHIKKKRKKAYQCL